MLAFLLEQNSTKKTVPSGVTGKTPKVQGLREVDATHTPNSFSIVSSDLPFVSGRRYSMNTNPAIQIKA